MVAICGPIPENGNQSSGSGPGDGDQSPEERVWKEYTAFFENAPRKRDIVQALSKATWKTVSSARAALILARRARRILNDRLHPWSSYHEARRKETDNTRKEMDMRRERLEYNTQLERLRSRHHDLKISAETGGTGPLFVKFPVEIRRRILIWAFGAQTVHLDLDFVEKKEWKYGCFQWSSCICHSDYPGQTHKAMRSKAFFTPSFGLMLPRDPISCPRLDKAPSKAHAGTCPVDCRVGAIGWLLACKQAYQEGLEILYQTNTIYVDSPALLVGMPGILAPERLSMIRSLEVSVHGCYLFHDILFVGNFPNVAVRKKYFPFPELRHLRVISSTPVGHLDWFDTAVLSIAPPGVEVTLSCWDWYTYGEHDQILLFYQGPEKTKMGRAKDGGLQCWREIPKSVQDSWNSRLAEEGPVRQGYWIHVSHLEILSDYEHFQRNIGQRRAELYDLEQGMYNYELTNRDEFKV